MKIYWITGAFFMILLGYINSDGTRYFVPKEAFKIIPMPKTKCILLTLFCIHKWKLTILYHLIFILPIFYSPNLKYQLISILLYFVLFTLYSFTLAILWHTKYDNSEEEKKNTTWYFMIPMFFFQLSMFCHYIEYIIVLPIITCVATSIYFYSRRYKYCE